MAERRFRVSRAARKDLLRIGRFTEQRWGTAKRNHYLGQLDDAFDLIGENDSIGIVCDEVVPGYRKFPEGSHVIFYRVTDMVEIIR
ncbi:type II toxin-antitoxin system RelE/ParE family toxin, partial [Klebsiella pneumoniae]|uniref:type II toxin-antitoxin system RelE/ParE family toxin n=1 Tax=Klebsiella pneumoniae TaxID=573 RepID=UPI00351E5149